MSLYSPYLPARSDLLYFSAMSTNSDSDAPDYSSYYYDQYKVAVYTNLFTGITYGAYIVLYVA